MLSRCLLYLIAGFPIGYLLTVCWSRLAPAGRSVAVCAVVVALALACITDYTRFQHIFVQYQLDDPAITRVVSYALAAGSGLDKAPMEAFARQEGPPAKFFAPRTESTPEGQLSRSQTLYDQRLFGEAIEAAREALRLRPGYAEAWNNIGAAYNETGQYDKAVAACEEALRLRPDYELARNNLRYAHEMAKPSTK